jgi:hypothetical protein
MKSFSDMSAVPQRDFRFRFRPLASTLSLSPDPVDTALELNTIILPFHVSQHNDRVPQHSA